MAISRFRQFTIICLLILLQNIVTINLFGNESNTPPAELRQELMAFSNDKNKIIHLFNKIAQLLGPSVVKIKMVNETNMSQKGNNSEHLPPAHGPEEELLGPNQKDFNLYKTFELPDRDVGSGFIIDAKGLIVTNYHVVKDFEKKKIEVTLNNGRKYTGEIVGFTPGTDLALIKINGKNLHPVVFGDNTSVKTGDWVVAIGNPYGHGQTISTGVISFTGKTDSDKIPTILTYEDFIQTDATINPGCSGGPLVNIRGDVIGINAAIATRRGGFQGIGFAIPATIVKKVVNDLLNSTNQVDRLTAED